MSVRQVVIEGTLNPDGTLELDEKPHLPPGRYRVVVQVLSTATPKSSLADLTREIDATQQARGFVGRSAEEIEAGLNEGEAEYEEKMRKLRPPAGAD